VFFASRFADKEIYALAYQLEQSLSRLQQFAERERHFSRDASHELRTPLAVIQTSAELLMLEATNKGIEGAAARRLQQIQQASSQMQQLIETLLLLSREGKGEAPQPVALKAMLQQLWLAQQQWQSRTDLQLELDITDDATFFAPELLLRLLLNNLLQNAVCHSGAGVLQLQFEHNQLFLKNPLAAQGQPRQGLRGFGTGIAERLATQSGLQLKQYQDGEYWYCCVLPLDNAECLQGN
jgi:signal transduction histidine kinase